MVRIQDPASMPFSLGLVPPLPCRKMSMVVLFTADPQLPSRGSQKCCPGEQADALCAFPKDRVRHEAQKDGRGLGDDPWDIGMRTELGFPASTEKSWHSYTVPYKPSVRTSEGC